MVIKKYAYQLPYISDILDKLTNVKYLSSYEVKWDYWQITISQTILPSLPPRYSDIRRENLAGSRAGFKRILEAGLTLLKVKL